MLSDCGKPVRLRRFPSAFFFYIYQPSDLCSSAGFESAACVCCVASMKLFLELFCKLAIRLTKTFSQEIATSAGDFNCSAFISRSGFCCKTQHVEKTQTFSWDAGRKKRAPTYRVSPTSLQNFSLQFSFLRLPFRGKKMAAASKNPFAPRLSAAFMCS